MAETLDPEDKEKSLYLSQIRYLDEQLERCQLRCDELEKQNKDFVSLYRALEQEKMDITEYLKHSVAAKDKEADELLKELETMQQATEQDMEALKLLHREQQQELQEQIDELSTGMTGQVAVLKEQQKQKEQLVELLQQMPPAESLEMQLLLKQEQHEAAVRRLKNEAVTEKTKWREEMQSTMIDSKKKEILKTFQEEQAQNSEQLEKIQVLLKKNMKLWAQNKELEFTTWDLYYDLDQIRDNMSMFNLDVYNSKKVEELTMTLQQLKEEREDCDLTKERLQTEEESLRLVIKSLSDECCQKTAEAAQVRAELQEETSRTRQLEGDMQEAAALLRRALMDSEKLSEKQMQKLLEILERNVPQGIDPPPQGTTEQSCGGQKPQTSVLKPDREETQNLSTDPLFLMARYRLGDLGFVPRPTWKQKPAQSSSQLPLNRKVCSQETPSESAPAPQQVDSEAGSSTLCRPQD